MKAEEIIPKYKFGQTVYRWSIYGTYPTLLEEKIFGVLLFREACLNTHEPRYFLSPNDHGIERSIKEEYLFETEESAYLPVLDQILLARQEGMK